MDISELRERLIEQESMTPSESQANGEMIGQLLEDEKVKGELSNFPIWAGLTNSSKLTFLDNQNYNYLMLKYRASVCKLSRIDPQWFKEEANQLVINNGEMVMSLNLNRSVGTTNPNLKNERVAITAERKEVISDVAGRKQSGFLAKLFGQGE